MNLRYTWCIACAIGLAASAAQAAYLPLPGGTISEIWSTNSRGEAVGFSNDAALISQAVYWHHDGAAPISLTPDSDRYHGWVATGINEFSQIVGNGSNCASSGFFCFERPTDLGLFPPADGFSAFIWFTPSSELVRLYNFSDCGGDNVVLSISGWVAPRDVPLSNCSPHVIGRTISEPSTFALLSLALAGLGFSRRRKLH